MKEKYKGWEILDEIPEGWSIDKTAGSPAPMTVFITDGKSVLKGQKRALLRVRPKPIVYITEKLKIVTQIEVINKDGTTKVVEVFPSKAFNTLARKRFEEQMLKDIYFDLTVCEIEGWDKKEYIKELKALLNGFDLSSNKKTNGNINQLSLFV